jgi:flavin-dependent dehydrogenase
LAKSRLHVKEYSVKRVDLVIAGAGFAGLACARAAATLGLRVVVFERKPDPGASCRTTGLLVEEAAAALDFPRRLARKVSGVRLYGPSLRSIDLERPSYRFHATDTPGLLRWLAREAVLAGAEVRCGGPYEGARRTGPLLSLEGRGLETRFLVGADGARSKVARDFGLGRNRSFLSGVELELEGVEGVEADRLHVFLDPALARGYIAWAVPGVGGITQVGLCARPPDRPRPDLLLERLSRLFDFRSARVLERRAGLIPVGGPVRPWTASGVLLLGDAAGQVSPLTGGGIHAALRTGRRAGQAIADHLLEGGPEPSAALGPHLSSYRFKTLLRRAFDLGAPPWVIDLALPVLGPLARLVFFHERGLCSPAAWRDLFRTRPLRSPAEGAATAAREEAR